MAITIKEIHKIVSDVKSQGHNLDDIEAILINRDDFKSLCNYADWGSIIDKETNEPRIYGIKVIESEYIQSGSIFPVFKKGIKNMAAAIDFYDDKTWTSTVPGSGSIQRPKFGVPYSGTIPESGNIFPKSVPTTTQSDEKEKKHSTTRKIELD